MKYTTIDCIVETQQGKLRGFSTGRSSAFYGVRYAKARRFHMPEAPDSWEGVRDALTYGWACPTPADNQPSDETFMPLRFWPENEDCQFLNIWTPSLDADAKKPVMVWIHGGGYGVGSGIEHTYYHGRNLCEGGDVVVVTVNHRLNILGYLDLSPFGAEYANSANAGNADLVAALQWVHENISAFGGDPGNVTIFGQSGGGMKVTNLLQTPAADHLYHRAVIQSGIMRGLADEPAGDGTRIVSALLADLGLSSTAELELVPYQTLLQSYRRVAPPLEREGWYVGGAPKSNDWFLGDPMRVGFHEYAKSVPLLVGSTFAEFTYVLSDPHKHQMTDAEFMPGLRARLGDVTEEAVALYRAAWPKRTLGDLFIADTLCRPSTIEFAKKRAAAGGAPVYLYLFAYECPFDGGTPAWHCVEIPFIFRNTEMVARCIEAGVSDRLEAQVSDAWVQFARMGSPDHEGLPAWKPCTAETETTMIFDRRCEVKTDFDHAFSNFINEHAPQTFPRRQAVQEDA